MFTYLLAAGLMNGCLYGLAALGLVLVYRATNVINLAHGETFMIAGFLAYTAHVMLGLPYLASLALAVLGACGIGLAVHRIAFRPLLGNGLVGILLATIGLSFMLKGIGRWVWGGQGELVPFPPLLSAAPILVGELMILPQQLLIAACSLLAVGGFVLVFRYTRLGKFMQAVAENRRAAILVGIRLNRVYAGTLAMSGAAAGVAAALMAPVTLLYPDVGFSLFLKVLAAAAVGGLASISGTLVGGVVVGVAEQLVAGYVHTGMQEVTPFLVIILAFLFFPNGLFGAGQVRRV